MEEESDKKSIKVLTLISCILSAVGSFLIILTFFIWRDLRTKARKLLVYLSITTFFASVSYGYGIIQNYFLYFNCTGCLVQSVITSLSENCTYFWTVAIAIYLYAILFEFSTVAIDRIIWSFHVVCWGVPLVTVFEPGCLRNLGGNTSTPLGWCLVNPDLENRKSTIPKLICGKMWEIMAYFVLPILYILIKRKFNRFMSNQSQERLSTATLNIDLKLTLIPIIFLVLNMWGTVRLILVAFCNYKADHQVLILLHGVGDSFQGAANCIIFCFCNKVIRSRFLNSCRNLARRLSFQSCRNLYEESTRLLAE